MTIDGGEVHGRVEDVQERMTDQAGKVGELVSSAVGGLRDRTADVVRADGGSLFRELHKLERQIDHLDEGVAERLDEAEASLHRRLDALATADRRTSLPRRLFWLLTGAGLGVAAAYLADPDRGHARRAQLRDQAAARARELTDRAGQAAKRTADAAKGDVIEAAKQLTPDDVDEDPRTLEARIKSEVLGHRDDVDDVVLRVDGPGTVSLKGTVDSSATEGELLERIATIDGVVDVRSELRLRES
ncbi:MAG: BON domain-containing protein [Actinomycetota bacterium]